MAFDDLYAVGMAASPDYLGRDNNREDSEIGIEIHSPWGLEEEMQALLPKVVAFSKDVMEGTTATPEFQNRWSTWAQNYKKWMEDHSSLHERMKGSTGARLRELENEFTAFVDEFKQLGGKVAASTAVRMQPRTSPVKDKGGSTSLWTYILGGAALFAAGYAGYTFAKEGLHSYKRKLGVR